jgi:hypothetical protein
MALRRSDYAWMALGVGILTYELLATKDELMSDAADRYRIANPWVTYSVILAVALHLARKIPHQLDVLHQLEVLHRYRHPRNPVVQRVSPQKV